MLVEEYRDAVLEVLASYLAGTPSPTASDAAVADDGRGSLRPEDDLTANRPGMAVSAKLNEVAPGIVDRLVAMLLGRRSEA
ncbi:hypothetical protein [Streptomyces violaceusniger]|uniref:hypothetical protein n=1 Tax=Streptomyces violaceusniger TaxID=68280 RepID=UPI0005B83C95|nr:hypothetical protein [Streptomyces violaceusniger]